MDFFSKKLEKDEALRDPKPFSIQPSYKTQNLQIWRFKRSYFLKT